MIRSAEISEDGLYRYSLTRRWEPSGPVALWVMLNPSTANAEVDDPTIRRCISFSQRFRCAALEVVNLFAYRSTDPKKLRAVDDPIGPDNLRTILVSAKNASLVIAAWGEHERHSFDVAREDALVRSLACFAPVLCLGRTKRGFPRHPLYVAGSKDPEIFHAEKVKEVLPEM